MATATRGGFYAIDAGRWRDVCALGLNPAVAYLVLARFSGRSQRFTNAGAQAIEKYTGISRQRASAALQALEAGGVVERAGESRNGRAIILTERPDFIWLPNALVTGAAGEVAPVELVRQTHDVLTLRLLVELYASHNLTADGGIDWRLVRRQPADRRVIVHAGQTTVWGFAPVKDCTVDPSAPFAAPYNVEGGAPLSQTFWPRFDALKRLGLVAVVGHLIEAETIDAEILHPFDTGAKGEPIEHELALAADTAGRTEAEKFGTSIGARGDDWWLVPLPAHLRHVAMIGVFRLRYRPKTSASMEWHSELVTECTALKRGYEEIAAGERRVVTLNAASRELAASR